MIDAILFDIDDTICEYRRHGSELLDLAFDRVDVEPMFGIEDYYAIFDDYAEGSDGVDDNRERCFSVLASEAGYDPEVGREVARAYADERDHRNVRFRPGAREAIDHLGVEYRLGVVTNGSPEMQRQKLDALGIADAFETVVHGGHDSPPKPSPEPFRHALDALSVEPDRAVHVGNSLSADVAGAHAAGVRSVWVPPDGVVAEPDPEPHHVLESLHDLRELPWERSGRSR